MSAYSLSQRSSDSGSEAYLSGNMAPEAHSMVIPWLLQLVHAVRV